MIHSKRSRPAQTRLAVLISVACATLATLAVAIGGSHGYVLPIVLLSVTSALLVTARQAWAGVADHTDRLNNPPPLAAHLAWSAQEIIDRAAAWTAADRAIYEALHLRAWTRATAAAERRATATLERSGRNTPTVVDNFDTLSRCDRCGQPCEAAAVVYLAVLTADLIGYSDYQRLTRWWRDADLMPLPLFDPATAL